MTELTTRQFVILSLFLILTSKLMTMPINVYAAAQNDAIFCIIIGSLVEIGLVSLIALVIYRNPGVNLLDLLKAKLGSCLAYITVFVLYVFLISKFIFVLLEIFAFFKDYLYDDFNPVIFALATFFVIGYISYKGCRTMGRTCEILFPIIVIGLIIALVSNIKFVTFDKMLPYFDQGILPTIRGAGQNMFYFGNALPLLFFVGKVKLKPHFVAKTAGAGASVLAFVLIFCFAFYDIFGYSTILSSFAISDYTQYDPYILDLQRLNWLSMMLDITKLFCSASILLYCMGQAAKWMTHARSSFFPIIGSLIIQFALSTIINFSLHDSQTLISDYLSYITLGLMGIVAILCIIFCLGRSKCQKDSLTKS